ncbi:MAG: hypothetical protein K2M34_03395 [Alphaproteobacteria bacterium]|nr:hypothetical protein [Alphaproteobacteria bacterium]
MKSVSRFLLVALALISVGAHASPVATTAGSNLTAYNPNGGAVNNNTWNSLTNPRSGADVAPVADFGNCNALIMRCAQPKCANGGCTNMDVTSAIVNGCVNSNDTCKQYGADLVNYISGQLVAQSTAKTNQANVAAQNAAAQQNSQQMAAMQQQMASLQQQIADSNANMQAAIEAQQQATAQAIADAAASVAQPSYSNNYANGADTADLTVTQQVAVESGVSEDLVLRETISGQILTQIENAEKSLKTLEQAMQNAFEYAGCDKRGDNCSGPKRVKKFKDLAGEFFDPYEDVLDDLYEAIYLAQTVGVDVSNIYMMLNNSCERWAKYTCAKPMVSVRDKDGKPVYAWPRYDSNNCRNNKSVANGLIRGCVKYDDSNNCTRWGTDGFGSVRGGMECYENQTIPPEDDTSCTAIQILSGDSATDVARGFLYPDEGDMGDMVRVGCASNALKGSWLFRGRKQQASIDIETLRRIIEQDNAQISFARQSKNALGQREQLKYCALTESGYMNLQKYVSMRGLPTKNICVNERTLNKNLDRVYVGESESVIEMARQACEKLTGNPAFSEKLGQCFCRGDDDKDATSNCNQKKSQDAMEAAETRICERIYGGKYLGGKCDCTHAPYDEDRELCETRFERPDTTSQRPDTTSSGSDLCGEHGGKTMGSLCRCSGRIMDVDCCRCINGNIEQIDTNNGSCTNKCL